MGGDLSILPHSRQTSSVPLLITPATYQSTVVSLSGLSLPSALGDKNQHQVDLKCSPPGSMWKMKN